MRKGESGQHNVISLVRGRTAFLRSLWRRQVDCIAAALNEKTYVQSSAPSKPEPGDLNTASRFQIGTNPLAFRMQRLGFFLDAFENLLPGRRQRAIGWRGQHDRLGKGAAFYAKGGQAVLADFALNRGIGQYGRAGAILDQINDRAERVDFVDHIQGVSVFHGDLVDKLPQAVRPAGKDQV